MMKPPKKKLKKDKYKFELLNPLKINILEKKQAKRKKEQVIN